MLHVCCTRGKFGWEYRERFCCAARMLHTGEVWVGGMNRASGALICASCPCSAAKQISPGDAFNSVNVHARVWSTYKAYTVNDAAASSSLLLLQISGAGGIHRIALNTGSYSHRPVPLQHGEWVGSQSTVHDVFTHVRVPSAPTFPADVIEAEVRGAAVSVRVRCHGRAGSQQPTEPVEHPTVH